jgi:hypothetical protein
MRLKSKNLWVDQSIHLTEKNITHIEIWVNPQNYKKYLMNTDIIIVKKPNRRVLSSLPNHRLS